MTKYMFQSMALLPIIALFACSAHESNSNHTPGGVGDNASLVSINSGVSDCGGFHAGNRDTIDYCSSELLLWSHNSNSRVLSIAHTRTQLDCCGEHAIDAFYDPASNTYTVVETDKPRGGDPCRCICVFDLKTEITNVDSAPIELSVLRDRHDGKEPIVMWAGTLDLPSLTSEMGVEVISTDPMPACSHQ